MAKPSQVGDEPHELSPSVIAQAQAQADDNDSRPTLRTSRASSVTGTMQDTLQSRTPEPGNALPPAYGQAYGSINVTQDGMESTAYVSEDGRVDINVNEKSRRLSSILIPALRNQLNIVQTGEPVPLSLEDSDPTFVEAPAQAPPPPMNIVIHVVGSRGDVQPFIALGQELKKTYKHRVRLATHPTFRELVEENGLEFFSIGGDPAELMAFMVKNPGLMPGKNALKEGEIGRRRKGMYQIIQRCWRSCYEAGDGTGIPVLEDHSPRHGSPQVENLAQRPFIADAIIANPPSYAHIHCAEKLGIPLHIMFTMPWSPTQAFPHPLANIQSSNADPNMTNFLTYALIEMMTWQGLGDLVNSFRQKNLGLEPLSLIWAPGLISKLKIPHTYCWSPALIPKPRDWPKHISVSGFYFLPLAGNYRPPADLKAFLENGPPPVYIGFGSIVVDDPNGMTRTIFEAVRRTGQRALVSKGWGGFGADALEIPDGVFMLGNVPHDWLFKYVSCVVHHGGAGTTAAGIALGKPTVIVPFFGDQPFWGAMIAGAGAGPSPIPSKQLTADKLATAIIEALKPSTMTQAKELGKKIVAEKGVQNGSKSFHSTLSIDKMRCSLAANRVAAWQLRKSDIRLSPFAATVLGNEGLLDFQELKTYCSKHYETENGPWDPITGGASALIGTISSLMGGAADIPTELFRSMSTKKGSEQAHMSKPITSPNAALKFKDAPTVSHSQRHAEGSTSTSRLSFSTALDASEGVGRIVSTGLKSPMDFTLALAQGFHNAPKLYGDDKVRQVEPITGFQSGLRAAGKEFGYGMYDGISGLVTQPLEGAKKEGFAGFVKGFGKGIGGVILKPSAAFWGVPGYTSKGIYKELQKHFSSSIQDHIIAARTAQGYDDWQKSTSQERLHVINRWRVVQADIVGLKKQGDGLRRHVSFNKSLLKIGSQGHEEHKGYEGYEGYEEDERVATTISGTNDDLLLEGASTSDEIGKEDAMFAQAIRASMIEIRRASREESDDEQALRKAIEASIIDANSVRPQDTCM